MSYGKEIYDNFINYCKEINMVNWIYELEWNCDGNLLFYIQNEGEGIALLWQCECQDVYKRQYQSCVQVLVWWKGCLR